ncbi:hypothetical protein DFJ67_1042 [Asanoa ferruginea]|uniref:Uncharacterized protein n=1 Tax=Asanoa ferruginea TaxID=53367 RepID=A0A3D9ZF59_9ACTN|nr:hypothetical protein DFJ67_1042 [Asanoa ferruginea]
MGQRCGLHAPGPPPSIISGARCLSRVCALPCLKGGLASAARLGPRRLPSIISEAWVFRSVCALPCLKGGLAAAVRLGPLRLPSIISEAWVFRSVCALPCLKGGPEAAMRLALRRLPSIISAVRCNGRAPPHVDRFCGVSKTRSGAAVRLAPGLLPPISFAASPVIADLAVSAVPPLPSVGMDAVRSRWCQCMSGRVGSLSAEAGGGAEPALGCWLAGLITWVRSPSAVGIGAVGGSGIGRAGAGAPVAGAVIV